MYKQHTPSWAVKRPAGLKEKKEKEETKAGGSSLLRSFCGKTPQTVAKSSENGESEEKKRR